MKYFCFSKSARVAEFSIAILSGKTFSDSYRSNTRKSWAFFCSPELNVTYSLLPGRWKCGCHTDNDHSP
ncbi:MAG: hypothetical protein ABSG67_13810, partial [Thermoguttaceae bacterium]